MSRTICLFLIALVMGYSSSLPQDKSTKYPHIPPKLLKELEDSKEASRPKGMPKNIPFWSMNAQYHATIDPEDYDIIYAVGNQHPLGLDTSIKSFDELIAGPQHNIWVAWIDDTAQIAQHLDLTGLLDTIKILYKSNFHALYGIDSFTFVESTLEDVLVDSISAARDDFIVRCVNRESHFDMINHFTALHKMNRTYFIILQYIPYDKSGLQYDLRAEQFYDDFLQSFHLDTFPRAPVR